MLESISQKKQRLRELLNNSERGTRTRLARHIGVSPQQIDVLTKENRGWTAASREEKIWQFFGRAELSTQHIPLLQGNLRVGSIEIHANPAYGGQRAKLAAFLAYAQKHYNVSPEQIAQKLGLLPLDFAKIIGEELPLTEDRQALIHHYYQIDPKFWGAPEDTPIEACLTERSTQTARPANRADDENREEDLETIAGLAILLDPDNPEMRQHIIREVDLMLKARFPGSAEESETYLRRAHAIRKVREMLSEESEKTLDNPPKDLPPLADADSQGDSHEKGEAE